MVKQFKDARDSILKICRSEVAHWQNEIELMRAGKIIKHEVRKGRIVDTTKDSIKRRAVWIAEMEKTISKIESLQMGLSALWVAMNLRSVSTVASRELHRSARAEVAQIKKREAGHWSWGSARHAHPGKRTASRRLSGSSRSLTHLKANGPE
jgi:hypothetical protein